MRIQAFHPSGRVVGLGLTASLLFGSPVLAQDGMRYLSWSGKPANVAPPTAPQLHPVANNRYPSIASGSGRPSRYSPSVASGGLTPANAWMTPPAAAQPQAYAPQTYAPQPPAVAVPQTAMSAAPVYVQPAYAPQPMPGPHFQQQQRQLQQSPTSAGPAWAQPGYSPQVYSAVESRPTPPLPAPQAPQQPYVQQQAYGGDQTVTGPGWASPQPASGGAPVADPMAPRRDAPIFRIQGAQPPAQAQTPPASGNPGQGQGQAALHVQQTASAEGPARGGARYYSVHRAAGHEPDPTAMPESVYAVIPEGAFLDAARTDLADPPALPVQTRTINGRVQAINQGDNPSLP